MSKRSKSKRRRKKSQATIPTRPHNGVLATTRQTQDFHTFGQGVDLQKIGEMAKQIRQSIGLTHQIPAAGFINRSPFDWNNVPKAGLMHFELSPQTKANLTKRMKELMSQSLPKVKNSPDLLRLLADELEKEQAEANRRFDEQKQSADIAWREHSNAYQEVQRLQIEVKNLSEQLKSHEGNGWRKYNETAHSLELKTAEVEQLRTSLEQSTNKVIELGKRNLKLQEAANFPPPKSVLISLVECVAKTAIYPNLGDNLYYPALGLAGEAGEFANKVKKVMRDGANDTPEQRQARFNALAAELGDVFWYAIACCNELKADPFEVINDVIDKLEQRLAVGTIQGDGDNR